MTTTARVYMDSLGLDESLARLDGLLVAIMEAEKNEDNAKSDIALQREQLARREAEILMEGVEGKNENERKAALRIRQENDAEYKAITANLHRSESHLSAAQVNGAALRREWQYHRLRVELGMAKLGFFSGSGWQNTSEQPKATNGRELFG